MKIKRSVFNGKHPFEIELTLEEREEAKIEADENELFNDLFELAKLEDVEIDVSLLEDSAAQAYAFITQDSRILERIRAITQTVYNNYVKIIQEDVR